MVLHKVRQNTLHVTFISLIIVILVVISIKAYMGRGTPLRGGMPSGHTAIAFSILTSIAFLYENTLVISYVF
jgi:diacylglycerol kinase (ATP)